MKILTIHNFHRTGSSSGDDQVYINEAKLLADHGVEIVKYSVSNDDFDQQHPIGKMFATIGMLWSFKNYRNVKKLINKEKPDLVHVHTFFPLISPSILYAAKRSGVKVVATLHDTRFVCPCATSLRGDTICNLCGDGKYFRMCRYKCFKNSSIMSFIVACVFKYHRLRRTFYEQIDRYICLNDTQIELLKSIGFSQYKIVKKYNFVPSSEPETEQTQTGDCPELPTSLPDRYVVYFGRLGTEKGIDTLMKTWDEIPDIPLVIIGGGPSEQNVKNWAEQKSNVFCLGYLEHAKCNSIVRNAQFVVFPSIWYEGCSMVEIESEMMGKPIVATDIGFSREIINDGVNGFLVPIKNTEILRAKIKELWNDREMIDSMGKAAYANYLQNFTRENNYHQLMDIYTGLC